MSHEAAVVSVGKLRFKRHHVVKRYGCPTETFLWHLSTRAGGKKPLSNCHLEFRQLHGH